MTASMMRAISVCILALLLLSDALRHTAEAFYVPGAQEVSYAFNESVPFKVNSLRSSIRSFPYNYYKMPFCKPKELIQETETIGEIIWGDRMYNSLYSANMLKNSVCTVLPSCDADANGKEIKDKADALGKAINQLYRGYMNIDNLPLFTNGSSNVMSQCAKKFVKQELNHKGRGYFIGVPSLCTDDAKNIDRALINNHLSLRIFYNRDSNSNTSADAKDDELKYIVVGLEAIPYSVKWPTSDDCSSATDLRLDSMGTLSIGDVKNGVKVYWTYDVNWVHRDRRWATRWDFYMESSDSSKAAAHTSYIAATLMLVVVISLLVAFILLRTLHKDFNRYNSEDPEDIREETGWKLVHADVFRPPYYSNILAVMVANGWQIMTTTAVVLFVALLGFLSPSRRGSLLTAMIFTLAAMSIVSGYVCGYLLQYLNCRAWKHVFLCGATLPCTLCGVYIVIVIINAANGASTATPFGTMMQLVLLCLAVCMPLTLLGGSIAFKSEPLTNPVRVGLLAREIPVQQVSNSPLVLFTVTPFIPLVVVLFELNFILQDLWDGQIYYSFGFLAIVAIIWAAMCALVTVFQLYYVLCYENHRWWWIAFFVPGGFGVQLFVLSIIFFFTSLSVHTFGSTMLYFLYMGVVSYLYGLAAGAIGVTTGILFTRKIYAGIKID